MSAVMVGLALCLAVHLVVAATLKLRDLSTLQTTLVSVLPPGVWRHGLDSRLTARLVVLLELLAGVGLLAIGTPAFRIAAFLAAALLGCFTCASVVAYRHRLPCSCFGPTKRRMTKAETFRTFALAIMAAIVAGVGLGEHSATISFAPLAIGAAAALLAWIPVLVYRGIEVAGKQIQLASIDEVSDEQGGIDIPIAGAQSAQGHHGSAGLAPRTRRRFIAEVTGSIAAVVGLAALALPSAASAAISCEDLVSFCEYLCKRWFEKGSHIRLDCLQCCYDCYISCVHHTYKCHGENHCYGAWNPVSDD
jgi:hypothetical protein